MGVISVQMKRQPPFGFLAERIVLRNRSFSAIALGVLNPSIALFTGDCLVETASLM
jgi:hypothetical protein